MPTTTTELLGGLGFPEGPRWHDGRLWFSDFHDRVVRAVTPDGTAETVLRLDDSPSGLGWTPQGELLVVAMERRELLRADAAGGVRRVADLAGLTRVRANDMVVDAAGGAYVSSFGFDLVAGAAPEPTGLVRVAADGTAGIAADGLVFPNGLVLTPDGRTLIVAETYAARLTAFDVAADGSLSGRRVFAELPGIAPDGICLDERGHVWVATARTPEVLRVAEGGRVTGRVAVGSGSLSYACMLGGDDGRTLLMCAAPDFYEHNRAPVREAVLLATEVDVPHAGRP